MISALLPCRNEADNVPRLASELIPALASIPGGFEIVAVDDGSDDATAAELQKLSDKDPRVRCFRHPAGLGLGAALRTAIANARGEFLLALDADLSFSPEQIRGLWRAFEESDADCASGSPFLGSFGAVPAWRLWATRLMNLSYRLRFRRDLSSYTPIFRLYRARALSGMPLVSEGFEINAEILARLIRQGAKIVEVPATLSTRKAGTSKFRPFRELKNHLRLAARLRE